MSIIQQEDIPCPFCHKGKILCDHVPSVWSFKSKRTKTLPGSGTMKKSIEEWEVKTDCPNCGKTAKEIKRAMKEGVPPDKEKLKKRFEELQKLKEEMKMERERNNQ